MACFINAMPEYKNPHVKSVLHHLLFKEMNLKLARHFIRITSSQAISFYTLVILLCADSSFKHSFTLNIAIFCYCQYYSIDITLGYTLDILGLDILGLDILGLDILGLDILGLDILGLDILGYHSSKTYMKFLKV